MEYLHDIFYKSDDLSVDRKKELLYYCKEHCTNWWVDALKSFKRKEIEMNFDEMVDKLTDKCYFTIIHRRGHQPFTGSKYKRPTMEIGFTTHTLPVYYLWIMVPESKKEDIIKKFKLIPHESNV